MQLVGATSLELDLYKAALNNESLPCSDDQTKLAILLSDAANQLQAGRSKGQNLVDACIRFIDWANKDENYNLLESDGEYLAIYNAIHDALAIELPRRQTVKNVK